MDSQPNPFKPAQLRIVNFVGHSNVSTPANDQESVDSRQKKLDYGLQSPNQYVVKIGSQSHNISAISPLLLSGVSSPANFNLLSELGSANQHKNTGVHLDGFAQIAYDNSDAGNMSNINTKIAQILTDSRGEIDHKDHIDLRSPDARNELSFSMRTDHSIEMPEHSDSNALKQSLFKRHRKNKAPSKVTFDDSLNTDILYDPNVSSLHSSKLDSAKEKPKKVEKAEFISVYSNRPAVPEKDEDEDSSSSSSESEEDSYDPDQRKNSNSLDYRPERYRVNNHKDISQLQNSATYYGVSDRTNMTNSNLSVNNESRWSKLKEDQAAKLFEKRKNNIFKGLKKLNKQKFLNKSIQNQSVNSGKATTSSSSKKLAETKSEYIKPVSFYENNSDVSPMSQSKIKGMMIENPDKPRSASNQRAKRKSVTPQKSQRPPTAQETANANYFSHKRNDRSVEAVKTLSINLKARSRSLSHDEVKPLLENVPKTTSHKKNSSTEKKIDEIYKLAKEDVQKRIASIDRRLVENDTSYSTTKASPKGSASKMKKSQTQVIQVQMQQVSLLERAERGNSIERPEQPKGSDRTEKPLQVFDLLNKQPALHLEPKKSDSNRKRPEENPMKELKNLIQKANVQPKSGDVTPTKQVPKKNVTTASFIGESAEKDKAVATKSNLIKVERNPSPYSKDKSSNNASVTTISGSNSKRSQTAAQGQDSSPRFLNEKRLEYEYKSNSKLITPKKIPAPAVTRFSDLESIIQEKNSYSRIHNDREKRSGIASPKANQETLDESVATFKRLEKAFKAQTGKDSTPNSRRNNPYNGAPIKVQDNRFPTREENNSRINSKRDDNNKTQDKTPTSHKKEEVRHSMGRSQSIEKNVSRKNSPNPSPAKSFERSTNKAGGRTPQARQSTMKEPKIIAIGDRDVPTDSQGNKMPRSQSDQRIRVVNPNKSTKNIRESLNEEKIQLNNISNDISWVSPKAGKNMSFYSKTATPANKYGTSPRNDDSKTWQSSMGVRKSSSKNLHAESEKSMMQSPSQKMDYLKNLFAAVPNKKKPSAEKKSTAAALSKSEFIKDVPSKDNNNNNNFTYVTSSEDVEEMLKQNYKLLEIRNNQYVFSSN